MIALPVRVLLRSGEIAVIGSQVEIGIPPGRMLMGERGSGSFDMWFAPSGRWRESGEPHALDIIGFMYPDGHSFPLSKEFCL
jgi:hypothetical protein